MIDGLRLSVMFQDLNTVFVVSDGHFDGIRKARYLLVKALDVGTVLLNIGAILTDIFAILTDIFAVLTDIFAILLDHRFKFFNILRVVVGVTRYLQQRGFQAVEPRVVLIEFDENGFDAF